MEETDAAPSETEPLPQKLRTSIFGYRRADVNRQVAEHERQLLEAREECERLRRLPLEPDGLGEHLADLVRRFSETITTAEQDAAARAAAVIAEAEARAAAIEATARQLLVDSRDLASATYAEAGRRYDAVIAARTTAGVRVNDAIEQLATAVASLNAITSFPDLEPPVPAQGAAGEWQFESSTTDPSEPASASRHQVGADGPIGDATTEDDDDDARRHLIAFAALVEATRAEDASLDHLLDGPGS